MIDAARPLVVKLGGTTIAEERGVLAELAALSEDRAVVVVHGGGRRLTAWLSRLGLESHFRDGRRVTDDDTLEVALAVLRGVINAELVVALIDMGARSVGVSGVDGSTLTGARDPALGRVVTHPRADARFLRTLVASGYLPVVAPLALDETGSICNVNADDAAAAVASTLGAAFILLTDTDGVYDADRVRMPELTPAETERLIDRGVIAGGMVPKVRAASSSLSDAGSVAVIADGRVAGALARALADPEFGTRFRPA